MIPAKLYETFVECMCDDLVVMQARLERPVENGFQLEGCAHTPQLEVAQEQVTVREPGSLTVPVKHTIRAVNH
jgi:hypothetical protein